MHTYQTALALAKLRSEEARCVQHVNAVIAQVEHMNNSLEIVREPRIVGYTIDDWADGSTVKSFSDGKELS